MVCSFFHEETKAIKENFLENNKNFSHNKFYLDTKNDYKKFKIKWPIKNPKISTKDKKLNDFNYFLKTFKGL